MSVRFYIFPQGDTPKRVPQEFFEGLIHGRQALPQFANSKQKSLAVFLNTDDGKPVDVRATEASVLHFGDDGTITDGIREALSLVMDVAFLPPKEDDTVVQLKPRLNRKKLKEDHRWEPGNEDIALVLADIWPKKKSDRLQFLAGSEVKRPPKLTWDAKRVLDALSEQLWQVPHSINGLTEVDLKGLAFEATSRSNHDTDFEFLYEAVAKMATRRLTLLKRRRSNKGDWYAVLEIFVKQASFIEQSAIFHKKCSGKQAAEKAARELLKEHADKFFDTVEFDLQVMTDLEWELDYAGNAT